MPSKKALGKRKRDDNAELQEKQRARPTSEQAARLASVLYMMDEIALSQTIASPDWSYKSLKAALESDPPATFLTLREVLVAVRQTLIDSLPSLCTPAAPSPNSKRTAEDEAAIDAAFAERSQQHNANSERAEQLRVWFLQAQALLDELEHGKLQGRRGFLPPLSEASSSKAMISLHRMVGGSQDAFTSPAELELTKDALDMFKELKDTDVVSCDARGLHLSNRLVSARLSDSNLQPRPTDSRYPHSVQNFGRPKVKLTQFLSYDPFASFAPTHDSYDSQFGYYDSLDLLSSTRQMRDHEQTPWDIIEERAQESGHPTPTQRLTNGDLASSSEAVKLAGLTSDELQELYGALPVAPATAHAAALFSSNAERIRQLQLLQWERLRNVVAVKKQLGRTELLSDDISEQEYEVAASILQNLTEVVSAASTQTSPAMITTPSAFKAALSAPTLFYSDANPVSHRGTLDPNNVAVAREEYLTKLNYVPVIARGSRGRGRGGRGRGASRMSDSERAWH